MPWPSSNWCRKIDRAQSIKHGKTSSLSHDSSGIFANLVSPLDVMRYHSLSIDKAFIPEQLKVIAISSDDKEVMAIKHQQFPVYGLQFHPESIGTPLGKAMMANFLLEIEGKKTNEELFTPIS